MSFHPIPAGVASSGHTHSDGDSGWPAGLGPRACSAPACRCLAGERHRHSAFPGQMATRRPDSLIAPLTREGLDLLKGGQARGIPCQLAQHIRFHTAKLGVSFAMDLPETWLEKASVVVICANRVQEGVILIRRFCPRPCRKSASYRDNFSGHSALLSADILLKPHQDV